MDKSGKQVRNPTEDNPVKKIFQRCERGDSVLSIIKDSERRKCAESSLNIEHFNPEDCVCKKESNFASSLLGPSEQKDQEKFKCSCLCSYN